MLKGLWVHVRPYWGWWVGSILASIAGTNCALLIPKFVGKTIDDLRAGTPPGALTDRYALMIILASAAAGLLLISMRMMAPAAARKISRDLRRKVFERLTLMEPAFFQRYRTGDLLNRISNDTIAVDGLVGFAVIGFTNLTLNVLITVVYMMQVSRALGLMVLAAFPVLVAVIFVLLRVAAKRFSLVQERRADLSSKVQENVTGVRLVRASGSEEREERKFSELQQAFRVQVLKFARAQQPLRATAVLLLNLLFVASLLLVAKPLLSADGSGALGGLTLGGFVSFLTYLFLLSFPLLALGMVLDAVQQGIEGWRRVREILEAEPQIKDGTETLTSPLGEVVFENVTLRIDGRTLLDGVSFKVPAGRMLGITGRTGSGKSLIGALLARLMDPNEGRILIDGKDLRQFTLSSLRAAVGLVQQEPFVLSRTIAANIALGAQANAEQVRAAAETADLLANVEAMPQKFDTLVGERGVTLSGGQRQRAAIARTLVRGPKIVVLDDALSAVDAETEARILGSLKAALGGRTTLLIGHRVNTFHHADEILVLEAGKIVERGAHEALLAKGGAYAELEKRQRLSEALDVHA